MIYKKQYGHPFDTESVVGSFVPAMETIPYLTREPDGFSYESTCCGRSFA